jgi:hypothetical protein
VALSGSAPRGNGYERARLVGAALDIDPGLPRHSSALPASRWQVGIIHQPRVIAEPGCDLLRSSSNAFGRRCRARRSRGLAVDVNPDRHLTRIPDHARDDCRDSPTPSVHRRSLTCGYVRFPGGNPARSRRTETRTETTHLAAQCNIRRRKTPLPFRFRAAIQAGRAGNMVRRPPV